MSNKPQTKEEIIINETLNCSGGMCYSRSRNTPYGVSYCYNNGKIKILICNIKLWIYFRKNKYGRIVRNPFVRWQRRMWR